MPELTELITDARKIIEQILEHPDYKALLDQGYSADLNIADAATALSYLGLTLGYMGLGLYKSSTNQDDISNVAK